MQMMRCDFVTLNRWYVTNAVPYKTTVGEGLRALP